MSIDLLIAGIPLAGYGYVLWLARTSLHAFDERQRRVGHG